MSNSFFVWDPSKYSVHVMAMDQEHQELIKIMNRLYEKADSNADKSVVGPILKELGEFVLKHFADEEAFFDKLQNYDKKEVHKQIHKDLVDKFLVHAGKFEQTGKLTPDFFAFLKVWLTAHIAGVDMKYGEAAGNKAA